MTDTTQDTAFDLSILEGITPGPWEFYEEASKVAADRCDIAEIWQGSPEWKANARAIAAIPAMKREIERLRKEIASDDAWCKGYDQARSEQIAKIQQQNAQIDADYEETESLRAFNAELVEALQQIVDLQDRMISGEGAFMRALTIART